MEPGAFKPWDNCIQLVQPHLGVQQEEQVVDSPGTFHQLPGLPIPGVTLVTWTIIISAVIINWVVTP